MVYKVCEFKGLPRIKISEEAEKSTIPGSKSILRQYDESGRPKFDVLCLSTEDPKSIEVAFSRNTPEFVLCSDL